MHKLCSEIFALRIISHNKVIGGKGQGLRDNTLMEKIKPWLIETVNDNIKISFLIHQLSIQYLTMSNYV